MEIHYTIPNVGPVRMPLYEPADQVYEILRKAGEDERLTRLKATTPLGSATQSKNPSMKLDHAKREIVAARFFEVPADVLQQFTWGPD